MVKINVRVLLILFGLIICGCNSHNNKDRYEVAVGEQVDIYYSTNSCCYYCVSNEKELKHLKLVDRKLIDSGPKDCEGCNLKSAFTFRAESAGIDTVQLKQLEATMECNKNDVPSEKYIIEIR